MIVAVKNSEPILKFCARGVKVKNEQWFILLLFLCVDVFILQLLCAERKNIGKIKLVGKNRSKIFMFDLFYFPLNVVVNLVFSIILMKNGLGQLAHCEVDSTQYALI